MFRNAEIPTVQHNTGLFFEQNCKNSRRKKLKTAKTQGKFCPKTQGTGAFPNLQMKETLKNVVKIRNCALFWHFIL